MSFQNVGKPRLFISYGDWLKGLGHDIPRHLTISPYETFKFTPEFFENTDLNRVYAPGFEDQDPIWVKGINFFAVLNHDLGDRNVSFRFDNFYDIASGVGDGISNPNFTVNYSANMPTYDGFSIIGLTDAWAGDFPKIAPGIDVHNVDDQPGFEANVGCWVFGSYYDMDAPNLQVTMTREFGKPKVTRAINGGETSNTMWSKQPNWGTLGAWELAEKGLESRTRPEYARAGKRVWSLKFPFIDRENLFGINQNLSFLSQYLAQQNINLGYNADDVVDSDFKYNIYSDDSFFSQVWQKTLGGSCKMLFMADRDNKNPDQFAIVQIRNNSLKATQTAHNMYDISLVIEEVF